MGTVTAFDAPGVRGFLHRPEGRAAAGLVVTHGAGGNCRTPLVVAVAAAFCSAGMLALRIDLPFRQRRATGPPSPAGAAADRAGLAAAVAALREEGAATMYLGGVSYGGRQASMLAAEQPLLARALLLLSYPLHPPGRPDRLRTAHFPELRVPALFIQGTRDPFGAIDEVRQAIAAIPAPTRLLAIEGAGHDLKRGRFDLGQAVALLPAL